MRNIGVSVLKWKYQYRYIIRIYIYIFLNIYIYIQYTYYISYYIHIITYINCIYHNIFGWYITPGVSLKIYIVKTFQCVKLSNHADTFEPRKAWRSHAPPRFSQDMISKFHYKLGTLLICAPIGISVNTPPFYGVKTGSKLKAF